MALTGSSSSMKDKRGYKDLQELLLLHRRYEEKAVRIFRKGLSDANRTDEKHATNRTQTFKHLANPATSNGLTETRARHKKPSSTSSNLQHGDLSKPINLNDQEYLRQLLLKSEATSNRLNDEHNATHFEDRAQLILPKLEGIPPENKEIFYTTLPKMPPLPKLRDSKFNTVKPHRKKTHNRQSSRRNEPSTFAAETCLTVRQLPRDHFMLHDSSSISAVQPFPRISPPREIDLSSEAITTDEGHLWLVPFVNIEIPPYRLAKWNELENGSSSTEGVSRHKESQNGVSSDKRVREIENSQPKYKRNVHFSEFLHEIHLYSPISTQSTKSAKEDGNNINN